jgi:hypothetical protein
MTNFIPGLELSKRFYEEVVKDILGSNFPDLKYSIGLLGHGSEVLGYDTELSTDHDWGPRLIMFLDESDYKQKDDIDNVLSTKLPDEFLGFSVSPDKISDTREEETAQISHEHRIEITTIKKFFEKEIGLDPYKELELIDWLLLPSQRLLSVTSGEVYSDTLGDLTKMRDKFSYYPNDIWLCLLSAQWQKISQSDVFMGRTGDVRDDLGSRIISAQMVKYVMELCFMMERKYIPYMKWFGTAFKELNCSKDLNPIFQQIFESRNWKERERYLSKVYEYLADKHNQLGITEPLNTKVTSFHGRPYLVIQAGDFSSRIRERIKDKTLKDVPSLIGSVDQFVASTDVLENKDLATKLKAIFVCPRGKPLKGEVAWT